MLNKKPKVLFVTGLFSPFQIEVANEVNRLALFDYHVAFTIKYNGERGKHWMAMEVDRKYIHTIHKDVTPSEQATWAREIVRELNADIIILAYYRGPIYRKVHTEVVSMGKALGFWSDPPNPLRPLPIQLGRCLLMRRNLRFFRFILAVDDRAEQFFSKCITSPEDVHFVPYGQDLSLHLQIERTEPLTFTHFLFSARLGKRHNIKTIVNAIVTLNKKRPYQFRFTFAGYGSEESIIQSTLKKYPELRSVIFFDRDYQVWQDRVKPMAYSDVLVHPTLWSGWGLIIPEAMAAGLCVITTRRAGAARHIIKNRINGIIISPTTKDLLREMEWCIDNKDMVFEIGKHARVDAQDTSAENVAKYFCNVIQRYLG